LFLGFKDCQVLREKLKQKPNCYFFTGLLRFILERAKKDSSVISLEMPKLRPPGGTIIVYDCHGIDQNRILHNDGYRWGRSKGVKLIQSVGNKLLRTYHFLYSPTNPAGDPSFKKYRFSLKGENYGLMVMHYLGDEKRAAEVSARCMRNSDQMAGVDFDDTQQRLLELRSVHLLTPSALDARSSEKERKKYCQVILTNVRTLQRHLLYENGETFVERIEFDESSTTLVFLFCYPLIEQLVSLSAFLQQTTPNRCIQLLYHTDCISSNYHLSTLAFQHSFFEGDQVMPVAFMVYSANSDRKSVHNSFLSTFNDRFGEHLSGRIVIVTGRNVCFSAEFFPIAVQVQCWDDFRNVKLKYVEAHYGSAYLKDYSNDMNILMSCTYEKLFDDMWAKISACKRYTERPEVYGFFDNVWKHFKSSNSIWNLRNCGVMDPDKGIYWKACKGLSKTVCQMRENAADLDVIVISLFLLSNAYRRHFIAGLHQSGAWRLKKCYRDRFQQSHLTID
uniref:SWIM-type domain-containing protein n=1 Tax=Gongylonema pulchrum TaxID=637853 RepID=A0A183DU28_9BILA